MAFTRFARRPSHPALWLALALLPLAGCAQTRRTADLAAAPAQARPTLSTSDSFFIDQVARTDLAEVQEGEVAEGQAYHAAVRQFGSQMAKEYGDVNERLAALARQKHVTPPTAPSDYQQGEIDGLQALSGTQFDSQYLDDQVANQQETLRLFQTEARQGTDPDVRAFAARYAPLLAQHLEMAEKLGGRSLTT